MKLSYQIVILIISVIILGGGIWNFFNHQYTFVSYQGVRDLHGGWKLTHNIDIIDQEWNHQLRGYHDDDTIFVIEGTTTPNDILPLEITSSEFFMSEGYHRLSVRFDTITQGTNTITRLPDNFTVEQHHISTRGPITTQRVTISYTDTLDQKTTLSLIGKESCPLLRPLSRSHTISCRIEGTLTIILPTQSQLQPLTVQGTSQYQSLL